MSLFVEWHRASGKILDGSDRNVANDPVRQMTRIPARRVPL
jgi:hypothetical protein